MDATLDPCHTADTKDAKSGTSGLERFKRKISILNPHRHKSAKSLNHSASYTSDQLEVKDRNTSPPKRLLQAAADKYNTVDSLVTSPIAQLQPQDSKIVSPETSSRVGEPTRTIDQHVSIPKEDISSPNATTAPLTPGLSALHLRSISLDSTMSSNSNLSLIQASSSRTSQTEFENFIQMDGVTVAIPRPGAVEELPRAPNSIGSKRWQGGHQSLSSTMARIAPDSEAINVLATSAAKGVMLPRTELPRRWKASWLYLSKSKKQTKPTPSAVHVRPGRPLPTVQQGRTTVPAAHNLEEADHRLALKLQKEEEELEIQEQAEFQRLVEEETKREKERKETLARIAVEDAVYAQSLIQEDINAQKRERERVQKARKEAAVHVKTVGAPIVIRWIDRFGKNSEVGLEKLTTDVVNQLAEVKRSFSKAFPSITVNKVEWIINEKLMETYEEAKRKLKAAGRSTDEKLLFHGTPLCNINPYAPSDGRLIAELSHMGSRLVVSMVIPVIMVLPWYPV
jgi:hypothetical protein